MYVFVLMVEAGDSDRFGGKICGSLSCVKSHCVLVTDVPINAIVEVTRPGGGGGGGGGVMRIKGRSRLRVASWSWRASKRCGWQ